MWGNHHLRTSCTIVGDKNGQHFGSISHPLTKRVVAAFVVVDVDIEIGICNK
jgi:hypothetical protein